MIKIDDLKLVIPLIHEDDDIQEVYDLFNIENTEFTSHRSFPKTAKEIVNFIKNCNTKEKITFNIVLKNKFIGRISLQQIDMINSNAEVALIIKKEFQGKGYGTIALKAIIHHAFVNMNVYKIYLGTPQCNVAMLNLADRAGMHVEAVLKNEFVRHGVCYDIIRFAIFNPGGKSESLKKES